MQDNIDSVLRNARKADVPDSTFAKVDAVLRDLEHRKDAIPMKPRIKRTAAVAAAIAALLAVSATAYVIYQYSLRDLVLPEDGDGYVPNIPVSDSAEEDDETVSDDPTPQPPEHGVTIISLQGYAGSPEYKAAAEWSEFCEGYDLDGSLLNEADAIQKEQLASTGVMSIPGLEDHYWMYYHAYTREMADKLDEIAEKYNLSLHTEFLIFDDNEVFIDYIAHEPFVGEGYDIYVGYAFDNGTFQFDGSIAGESANIDFSSINGEILSGHQPRVTLDGIESPVFLYNPDVKRPEDYFPDEWLPQELIVFIPNSTPGSEGEGIIIVDNTSDEPVFMTLREYHGDFAFFAETGNIGFQMRSCKKGILDVVSLNIGTLSDYSEWTYETACGITVSLSQSEYKSLIIVETENAFIAVNVLEGSDVFPASELEALADAIDFTLLK